MEIVAAVKRLLHRTLGEPPPQNNERLRLRPEVLHIGKRSYSQSVLRRGRTLVKKTFSTVGVGREAFRSERVARRAFAGRPWFPTWVSSGLNWYTRDFFPLEDRLDQLAPHCNQEQRLRLAAEALSIILDIYVDGYAHRDFQCGNLYLTNGRLMLVDYEGMCRYGDSERPDFWQSYDVTGQGLASPFRTGRMCYTHTSPQSVASALGVGLDDAAQQLTRLLTEEVRTASLTFTKASGRHVCRAGRAYSTILLPRVKIGKADAQRDSQRRCERFGIGSDEFEGARVLDLGSGTGAMVFESATRGAAESYGVECDEEKVRVAKRIAVFESVRNVNFAVRDIDRLTLGSARGPYDVVFCLSVNRHVRDEKRLYRLLGQLTQKMMYFEGNGGTNLELTERHLRRAGFRRLEWLGMCDDDALEDNNCRPLLRADK